jgi:hypothetical protein
MRRYRGISSEARTLESVLPLIGRHVDVLPFYLLGRHQWHQLGMPYSRENVAPPANGWGECAGAVFLSPPCLVERGPGRP